MKERPILFNAAMVRAILAGQKTQTRRILKTQPIHDHVLQGWIADKQANDPAIAVFGEKRDYPTHSISIRCPYGQVGDRLWVRETFVFGYEIDDGCSPIGEEKIWYRATDALDNWYDMGLDCEVNVPWKPSIHMPRGASRILLEITDVRIERLQCISQADAIAEGCSGKYGHLFGSDVTIEHPIEQYKDLWESINGEGSWGNNPWVWAISFKRIEV